MYEVIGVASAVILAAGCYWKGIQVGHAEGREMRQGLEREIRGLRLGGSARDPFKPPPDRLTGNRDARRVYRQG
jgi:hypothetical protein